MIIAVIVMLCGVAFFSYIMGNFIENISEWESKMGFVDKRGDLDSWIISLSRYTQNQPLPTALQKRIESDFNFIWSHDRLISFDNDNDVSILPIKIKIQLISDYLFEDVFNKFTRFFVPDVLEDKQFLYDIAFGFLPRKFDSEDDGDKVIYDEDQEVSEIYFIQEGFIGIGFTLLSNGM